MNLELEQHGEPLPGYHLLEKLGAGGYGEVWRVEAPGGLEKAIKFVFGTEHEKRAMHELKSLKRIKELRHPFLLSLERIEVVDGRLLVVTELADGSLKDLFDQHQQQGQPGVPRDELLGYLRDAADALDYMYRAHALQHLDIKPENLLIVGGHVKVADFGLVKDVQQSQASIVGGMTPLYSAPEVFRGRPGARSDQYSLAIVYQEMLTGMLPFSGVTAAELTLQHLNDEPGLSPLEGADRFIVARALSKDPAHRYDSCRDFVAALLGADSKQASGGSRSPAQPGARCSMAVPTTERQGHATEVFDDDDSWQQSVEPMLIDVPVCDAAEAVDLGPIDFTPSEFQPCATLFLGVGGAGGRVLSHLRQMMTDRVGQPDLLPSMRMLLLDTDPHAVMSATRDEHGLTAEETLAVPLRRPQHYRENAARLLNWLSRRWLYNVPKSMRTEGLRPLGRLALVDHARQVCQRIRQSIVQATDDVSIAQTRDTLGLTMANNSCRVYIVASIAGGTGSGTVIDLGYAVRAALEKLEIANPQIIALLTHSTTRDPRESDLARVNTYSWLNEFQHFLLPNVAYPGDSSCGLPAHPAGIKPFDHTYLLHLGDGLNDDDFDHATTTIADYLYLDCLTAAGTFFESCRNDSDLRSCASAPTSLPIAMLRSFGLERVSASPAGMPDMFADQVCGRVFARWLEGDAAAQQEPVDFNQQLQLSAPTLAAQSRKRLATSLGGNEEDFLKRWLQAKSVEGQTLEGTPAMAAIDSMFRKSEDGTGSDAASLIVMRQPLAAIVEPLVEHFRTQLNEWFTTQLDDPRRRLAGSRRAADALVAHLDCVQSQCQTLVKQLAARLVEFRQQASAPVESTAASDPHPELSYFQLRLDHCAMIAARHVANLLVADCKSEIDRLNQLGRDLKQMASHVEADNAELRWLASDSQDKASAHLQQRIENIVDQVDEQLGREFVTPQGGLQAVFSAGGRVRAQLFARMKEITQRAIQLALNDVNVLEQALDNDAADSLEVRVTKAEPELLNFGGSKRVLAVLPKTAGGTSDAERVQRELCGVASLLVGNDNGLVLCVEAQDLPLPQVALNLVQRRRDFVEFAERVHSRSDLSWSKITDQVSPATAPERPAAFTMALDNSCTQPGQPLQDLL